MPIYEYNCPKCGEFEVTQRITENALKKCPTCKSKIERVMSRTSFILKGTGWYVTDYAKSGGDKSKVESSKSESKPDSAKAETAKVETTAKPESPSSSGGSKSTKSDTGTAASSSTSS